MIGRNLKKNNETIALNILQILHNEKNITHVYKSKHDHTRKNQVVLLMISDGEKWHYTALKIEQAEDGFIHPTKRLSRLFKGITSNVYIHLEYITLLKNMKTCVKIMIFVK